MRIVDGLINEQYPLRMPKWRAAFHRDRPNWERNRLADMAERVQPGMRVFDCGSELGDFSALYNSWVGTEGEVVLIEPSDPNWPVAKVIWEANHPWTPRAWFRGFVADSTLRKGNDFGEYGWPDEATGSAHADPERFQHLVQGDHISRITIDDLAKLVGLPDVLVLDTEGSEWHVLSGALDCLRFKPVLVYVSIHDIEGSDPLGTWYGKTAADIDALMDSVGYSGIEFDRLGAGERFVLYTRG